MQKDIPRINKSLFSQLLAIDGGSQDGTIEYLKNNGFEVVVQEKSIVFFKNIFLDKNLLMPTDMDWNIVRMNT